MFGRRLRPAATSFKGNLVLELTDLAQDTVRKLQRARCGGMDLLVVRQASPGAHFFAAVVEEDLGVGAGAAQRDGRVGLKRPVRDLAFRVPDVDVEVRVR